MTKSGTLSVKNDWSHNLIREHDFSIASDMYCGSSINAI